ncbi:hypothetical protein [Naumannella halotolerans]|uniref:Uncharacterized protein n=1 Tax=Naumannella halotolerans TaxID=993414 RepID=A0A4R7J8P5_9ACTN|nr:hypothetical protein [Naumannella halotolerans]TDT33881.1 hypothetical protein CLV29_1516 [Naumannella halotolerans]
MSVVAVIIMCFCLAVGCAFGGWQLGWGIRAILPRSAPRSFRTIGLGFLAAEVWALAAIALFPALFPRSEAAIVEIGWLPIWIALGSWLLRDLVLWWVILVDGAPLATLAFLLAATSAVMTVVLGAGLGWALVAAGRPVTSSLLIAMGLGGFLGAALLTTLPRVGGAVLAVAAAAAVLRHLPSLVVQAEGASSLTLVVPLVAAGLGFVVLLQLGWWLTSCRAAGSPGEYRRDTMAW